MAESKKRNTVTRVVTALILAPLTIMLLYFGEPYVSLLLLAIGALLSWEWSKMVPNKTDSVYAVLYTAVMATAVLQYSISAAGLTVLLGTVFAIWKARREQHSFLLPLGVVYITVGIGSLTGIYQLVGFLGVVWFLLLVWSVDTGGYLVGSTVKGPKLAPKISPNKTWSGLLGGMLLAAAVSGLYAYYCGWIRYWNYAAIAACLAVVEQIGDLVESAIKRHLGLKDSSNLIPGHGGIFDRVDGLIFTAPVLYLLLLYCSELF